MGGELWFGLTCMPQIDQSVTQPFNYQYVWRNTTDNLIIPDTTKSFLNDYRGGVYQQATSVVTQTSAFYIEQQMQVWLTAWLL